MDVEQMRDLASAINQEHALVYQATIDALDHAIRCGQFLLEAREQVPDGKWTEWIEANLNIAVSAATRYQRIATYREHLLAAEVRPKSINAAMTYLRDLDVPSLPHNRAGKRPTFDVVEARRLRDLGMTYRDIGEIVGVSDSAVQHQLDPELSARRKVRRRAEAKDRRATEKARTEREANDRILKEGGNLALGYTLLLECIEALSNALIEADTDEVFGALSIALTNTQRAEGVITRTFQS